MNNTYQTAHHYRQGAASLDHHYYLTGPIEAACNYLDLFQLLDESTPNDVIYLHLNGEGGDLFTTIQIIHKMRSCQGMVVTSAEGLIASAHSIIFFAGNGLAIADHCSFLLHDGSAGEMGKISDNLAGAQATSKLISGLYHDVYSKHFTFEEIERILLGVDCWMTSDEVFARVEAYADLQAAENEEEEEEAPKPKKKKAEPKA